MKINMPADKALAQLRKALEQIDALKPLHKKHPDFIQWRENTLTDIKNIYGNDSDWFKTMNALGFSSHILSPGLDSSGRYDNSQAHIINAYHNGLNSAEAKLNTMIHEIETYHSDTPATTITNNTPDPLSRVETLCQRFHRFALSLKNRYSSRQPIIIEDEYDVQYLLGGLLKIDFDDIRPEEAVPSLAGKNARMDFLLEAEGIVVEAKMARKGHADKEIGEELTLDIAHYQKHPGWKHLLTPV